MRTQLWSLCLLFLTMTAASANKQIAVPLIPLAPTGALALPIQSPFGPNPLIRLAESQRKEIRDALRSGNLSQAPATLLAAEAPGLPVLAALTANPEFLAAHRDELDIALGEDARHAVEKITRAVHKAAHADAALALRLEILKATLDLERARNTAGLRKRMERAFDGRADVAPTPVFLFDPEQPIRTQESAATVAELRAYVKSLERREPNPVIRRLYASIRPEIASAVRLADIAAAQGYLQSHVAAFLQRVSELVELPIRYINHLADRGSGGTSDSRERFDARFYEQAKREFETRFQTKERDFRRLYAASFGRETTSAPLNIDTKPSLEGFYGESAREDYFFQYKYIYRIGEAPLLDFIKVRESGEVIVGIKKTSDGSVDGQRGLTSYFERHDYTHANLQKINDRALFEALSIKKVSDAIRLKRMNQDTVERRLAELRAVKNHVARKDIEYILFALMHEQALSYPIQVDEDLRSAERLAFYGRAVPSTFKRFRGPDGQARYNAALAWIKSRAAEDRRAVLAAYPNSDSPAIRWLPKRDS